MKNDLTTRTWQDDIWCPIIIILFWTSDDPMLWFYEKHKLASKSFLKKKKTQVEIFFESVFGKSNCSENQGLWLLVFTFWHDFTYLSSSNILIWTSTCGSMGYKRKIQNRKIQSKRVLGLTNYTHRLSDHNELTQ